ncbi:E3 ubiquitin-protein ligase RNF25 [Bacillus rossius redtenbacheri]|uniref:E3 ubiquitin-protein ligase RNF25 n=1 Tax=Bacillus rossius redtenbacheri TaxID=93214 RepID=UPI002FDE3E21
MENLDERVLDEIEALKAILMDEVDVKMNDRGQPVAVETVVRPSTADDPGQQYVCLTLVVGLTDGYPEMAPEVRLRNPRGLDDHTLARIERDLADKCRSYCGQPVVYELVELTKEHLTASNLPSCQCAICLYGFSEGDHFSKTECYHYFHSHCLHCLVTSTRASFLEENSKLPVWLRQRADWPVPVLCPVCRERISYDGEALAGAPPPQELSNAHQFEMSDELRRLQDKMAALFYHQKQRGGIIDPEADESKRTLVLDQPPSPHSETSPGPSLPALSPQHVSGEGARSWRRPGPPASPEHAGVRSWRRGGRRPGAKPPRATTTR